MNKWKDEDSLIWVNFVARPLLEIGFVGKVTSISEGKLHVSSLRESRWLEGKTDFVFDLKAATKFEYFEARDASLPIENRTAAEALVDGCLALSSNVVSIPSGSPPVRVQPGLLSLCVLRA